MATSGQVLKKACGQVGVKAVARSMNQSQSNVYRWFEERDENRSPGNPLSRCAAIIELTGDKDIIRYLCQASNGFFCENPAVGYHLPAVRAANETRLVGEFSHLLGGVAAALDPSVLQSLVALMTNGEAGQLRQHWEAVKQAGEEFVCSVEAKENGTSDD